MAAAYAEAHQILRITPLLIRLWRLTSQDKGGPLEVTYAWAEGGRTLIRVEIVASWMSPKGVREWFRCPECQRRVGALYAAAPGEAFACRWCKKLRYASQVRLRALERLATKEGYAWAKAALRRPRGSRQWPNWRPGRRRSSTVWIERGRLLAGGDAPASRRSTTAGRRRR